MSPPGGNPPVTQPGYGGTDPQTQEGPLRIGLIPRKITWPFAKSPFYADLLRDVSRRKSHGHECHLFVRVRHKTEQLAGGGVFKQFSKGR
jgi:hypothetical protein